MKYAALKTRQVFSRKHIMLEQVMKIHFCADIADIPFSRLENPKTAESALEGLAHEAEQLITQQNLQGLFNYCRNPHLNVTVYDFSRFTSSLCCLSPW